MNPTERHTEVVLHIVKRHPQRRPPPDQDVIMAGAQNRAARQPDNLTQPASHAIALDRIADLLRYREPHAHRTILSAAARLNNEGLGGRPRPGRGGPKVCSASQPLQ
jgi:hypothetical protein